MAGGRKPWSGRDEIHEELASLIAAVPDQLGPVVQVPLRHKRWSTGWAAGLGESEDGQKCIVD